MVEFELDWGEVELVQAYAFVQENCGDSIALFE